jgi:hypothetical protein
MIVVRNTADKREKYKLLQSEHGSNSKLTSIIYI